MLRTGICQQYKTDSQSLGSLNNMSEKLCLQWNDFQENVKVSFRNLRDDKYFTDVTLACEDGKEVEAHKVILASSSPFFQNLLERNNHPHPLVYMRGLKSDDLLVIVDFLYRGETNVFQENLDSFLAIAEELQLKGLTGKMDEKVDNTIGDEKPEILTSKAISKPAPRKSYRTFDNKQSSSVQIHHGTETNQMVALSNHFSGNLDELEERVRSMMEKSSNDYAPGRKADICKGGLGQKHKGPH